MLSFSDNPITTIALLLLGSFAVSILYKTFFTPLRRIPGPLLARYTYLWLPWKVSQGRNHIFWRELHAEHGPIVRVGPNRVTFSDPDLLSTVFGAGSTYPKSDFYNSVQFDLNDGTNHSLPRPSKANLFSSRDSSYHKRMKASVAQAYSLSFLTQLEPMVNECSEQFITKLRQVSKEGPLDLDKWLHFYAFDVIGMIAFSKSFGMIEAGKDDFGLEDLFQGIAYNSVVGVVPGLHAWLLGNDSLLRFLNSFESIRESNPALKVRNAVYKAMLSYNPSKNRRGDYISYLRDIQASNSAKLSDVDIIDSLMINIIVGSGTTSFTLTACFYYLVKQSQTYKKLRYEIDYADKAGQLSDYISFAEGNNLPYLRAVLKETLRLFPAVTMPLERVVPEGGLLVSCIPNNKDTIHLPACTRIGAAPQVLNTLPSVFGQDALVFRPERWLDSSPEQLARMEKAFFTFGDGSRICIGRHISTMEMTKVVPQILREFDLEWAGEEDEEWMVRGYWFSKPSGLKVRLRERNGGGR